MRSFSYLVSVIVAAAVLSACTVNPKARAQVDPNLLNEAQARQVFEGVVNEVASEQKAEPLAPQDVSLSDE